MDNFDYKKYLKSNRINEEVKTTEIINEEKKQGYDDREDESLGMRRGAEKGKKVSMKGRRDDSYGKFGKRDAEAKGKAKGPGKNKINKENVEINEFDADVVAVGAPLVMSVVAAGVAKMGYDAVMDMIKKKFPREDAKYSAEEDIDISVGENVDLNMEEDAVSEDARTDAEEEGYEDGFKDAKKDMKDALSKMKVSELKAKIREDIISTLNEQEDVDVDVDEEEDVDVDVDVEDKVSVDAEGDDIEIVKPAVKAKIEVGLSPEEEVVQDSLKAAMDAASSLGNEKLADQIGNTITFFTREYVVGNRTD